MTQKVPGVMLESGAVADADTGFTAGNYTRVAVDGTLEERTPAQVRNDIGAGTGSGTVTSVDLVSTTGLTASGGPVTGSGSLTYTLSTNLQAWSGLATSAKQDADNTLTALAGQNWAANSLAIGSGADTVAQVTFAANTFPARSSSGNLVAKPITDAALSVLDDTTVAAMRTTLGLPDGTYTPTYTNVTNVSANTPRGTAQYSRNGNTVTVSGQVGITPTAAGLAVTELRISLPVPTALTTGTNQIAGVAVGSIAAGTAAPAGVIYADVTNDAAVLRYNAPTTTITDFWFHFTYQVV